MVICLIFVIICWYFEYVVCGFMGVVVMQVFGYGFIFDFNFFLCNLLVMGGFLMVFFDLWVCKIKVFVGFFQFEEKDCKMYFQFVGCVLFIFFFIGFVFFGEWFVFCIIVSLLGLVVCVMVVVGFKVKFSVILLVVIFSVFNVIVNNFWIVSFFLSQ